MYVVVARQPFKKHMKGKKTGGRQKGTPNKATAFSKAIIEHILEEYNDTGAMAKDIQDLEPKDRLDIMVKLMAFVTPKPQSVDMSLHTSGRLTIENQLRELSEENEEAL